jgi:hypothetical protein
VRASIKELSHEQLLALVEEMQERRMRSHTLYEEAQRMKKEQKFEKDAARLEHLCEMFEKKCKTVDAGLAASEEVC